VKQLSLIPDSSQLEVPAHPTPLIHTNHTEHTIPVSTRRLLGAYYSPRSAADFMAEWCLRRDGERILEPSFGDGVFLRAIAQSALRKNLQGIHLIGVEFDEQARTHAAQEFRLSSAELIHEDFFKVPPVKVQAVIGNPPYVRLRRLARDQQQRALNVSQRVMNQTYDPSGSLWGPFLQSVLGTQHRPDELV